MHVVHMPLFQAVLMGLLQGLAEFAPISSSAHLVLVPWLFAPALAGRGWVGDPGQAFDAALHIGTAAALIVYFWADWKRILSAWWGHVTGRETWENIQARLGWLIIIASVPGAVLGKLFEKKFEVFFDVDTHPWAPGAIGVLLIVMGILLYVADQLGKQARGLSRVGTRDAVIIGLSQALALFPGVSRSGATITAGRAVGLNRETAARFSFLMATPITLGAGLVKVVGIRHAAEPHPQMAALILGVVVSAVSGYGVIRWLLSYLQRENLSLFVIYRVCFGLCILGAWLMRGRGL
jgi:undecaprenyl-diphosphatase